MLPFVLILCVKRLTKMNSLDASEIKKGFVNCREK